MPSRTSPTESTSAKAASRRPARRDWATPILVIVSLVLAAIGHGALAERQPRTRPPEQPSRTPEAPPFSLTGAWREIGRFSVEDAGPTAAAAAAAESTFSAPVPVQPEPQAASLTAPARFGVISDIATSKHPATRVASLEPALMVISALPAPGPRPMPRDTVPAERHMPRALEVIAALPVPAMQPSLMAPWPDRPPPLTIARKLPEPVKPAPVKAAPKPPPPPPPRPTPVAAPSPPPAPPEPKPSLFNSVSRDAP